MMTSTNRHSYNWLLWNAFTKSAEHGSHLHRASQYFLKSIVTMCRTPFTLPELDFNDDSAKTASRGNANCREISQNSFLITPFLVHSLLRVYTGIASIMKFFVTKMRPPFSVITASFIRPRNMAPPSTVLMFASGSFVSSLVSYGSVQLSTRYCDPNISQKSSVISTRMLCNIYPDRIKILKLCVIFVIKMKP